VGELPNGVLAMPRLLSNLSDAPMLGEAAILWQLSVQPEKGIPLQAGGRIPPYVYILLTLAVLFGTWRILRAIQTFRQARRTEPEVWTPKLQVAAWAGLVLGAGVTFWFGCGLIGMAMLVIAVMLPIVRRKKGPGPGHGGWLEATPAVTAATLAPQGTSEDPL
jgi:hypothetical protein